MMFLRLMMMIMLLIERSYCDDDVAQIVADDDVADQKIRV